MTTSPLSRRAFLGQASALASLTTSLACRPPASAPVRFTGDSTEISATAAVAAMRNGDIAAEAYATALLDRTERLQRLNAFRALNRDLVLASARAADKARAAGGQLGLLHGLPIPVKDSINTAAYPTSNG